MLSTGLTTRATAWVTSLVVLLSGCAAPGTPRERDRTHANTRTSPPPHEEATAWRLDELARIDRPKMLLRSSQGIHGSIETNRLQRILATSERIFQAAGEGPHPEVVVFASATVNAFAFINGSQPTIALTLGMIGLLESDDDAWAALFGHELAHLRFDHQRNMNDRREKAEITSSFAGLILSAIGLPFANLAADATAELAERAFSRNDEQEADSASVGYMRRAGFSATGAITLQQLLLTTRSNRAISFLSTHPSGEERIANLRDLIQRGN